MTNIYFVRHAQPDRGWPEDRTKPLTALGLEERKNVTSLLCKFPIDVFFSSPYKRSIDTISECANLFNMQIHIDERFRERQSGENGYTVDILEKRWKDFDFCEDGGESLNSVQSRNVEVLNELLCIHNGKNIVVGTHGTALSTILNYFDSSFDCECFKRIWHSMPYIILIRFKNKDYKGKEELLNIESFH